MAARPFGGTRRKAIRKSGFRARLKTHAGKQVIAKRRKRGRSRLSLSQK
jgi:large subunit ribosomal protein L34